MESYSLLVVINGKNKDIGFPGPSEEDVHVRAESEFAGHEYGVVTTGANNHGAGRVRMYLPGRIPRLN